MILPTEPALNSLTPGITGGTIPSPPAGSLFNAPDPTVASRFNSPAGAVGSGTTETVTTIGAGFSQAMRFGMFHH
jgi:hypothetical protein